MAKSPKFYPNLPRVKSQKKGKRVRAISTNTPVRVPRLIQADRLHKPTKVYTEKYLNINTSDLIGNDTRSGVKNPGWQVTIAKGGDATSGYSREHYSYRPTKYTVTAEDSSWLSRGSGSLYGGLLVQQNDTTALDETALARLKNRLNGKIGNAKLAPPLAESREIGRLVRQINSLGLDTVKAMLAAKKSKGKSVTKLLGQIWLGFGFGVNPLLKDIESAANSILDFTTRTDGRVVTRGTATTEYWSGTVPPGTSSDFIAQGCAIGFLRQAHHKQGILYVAGIDLTVGAGSNYGVTDHLGLKFGALPSILWELTYLSWVVDYFTTVGPWLDDVFYTIPGKVVYLSRSRKYQSETTCTPKTYPTAGYKVGFTGSPAFGRYTNFARTHFAPVLPTRSLRIKSVDEIAKNGLTKFLNLASVLASRRGPKLS
jgi:hypothetical protein